jgi:hypothetical protein
MKIHLDCELGDYQQMRLKDGVVRQPLTCVVEPLVSGLSISNVTANVTGGPSGSRFFGQEVDQYRIEFECLTFGDLETSKMDALMALPSYLRTYGLADDIWVAIYDDWFSQESLGSLAYLNRLPAPYNGPLPGGGVGQVKGDIQDLAPGSSVLIYQAALKCKVSVAVIGTHACGKKYRVSLLEQPTVIKFIPSPSSANPNLVEFSAATYDYPLTGFPTTPVTLVRTGAPNAACQVTVFFTDVSGLAGDLYSAAPVTVTFRVGESSAQVPIDLKPSTVNGLTLANLSLGNFVGGTPGPQATAVLRTEQIALPPVNQLTISNGHCVEEQLLCFGVNSLPAGSYRYLNLSISTSDPAVPADINEIDVDSSSGVTLSPSSPTTGLLIVPPETTNFILYYRTYSLGLTQAETVTLDIDGQVGVGIIEPVGTTGALEMLWIGSAPDLTGYAVDVWFIYYAPPDSYPNGFALPLTYQAVDPALSLVGYTLLRFDPWDLTNFSTDYPVIAPYDRIRFQPLMPEFTGAPREFTLSSGSVSGGGVITAYSSLPQPTFSVSFTNTTILESDNVIGVVTLASPAAWRTRVPISTVDGSAVVGTNFAPADSGVSGYSGGYQSGGFLYFDQGATEMSFEHNVYGRFGTQPPLTYTLNIGTVSQVITILDDPNYSN